MKHILIIKGWTTDRGLVIKNISTQVTCINSPFYIKSTTNLLYKVTVLTRHEHKKEVYRFRNTFFGYDIEKQTKNYETT